MIYLSPYNSEWPKLYEAEKEIILDAIGQFIVEINHIGSTSIPGMIAKPVIDIMIGVYTLDDITSNVIGKLEQLNYCYVKKYEDMMPYRRFFQKDNQSGKRTHQIHLVKFNSDFWNRHLLFRDYIRAHAGEAKRYEKLKQELALNYTDTNEYAKAKTDFCNEIHLKALAWINK